MNLTRKRMLDEEYERTLESVSRAATGTEEAKWGLQKLTELHKQMMDEELTEHKCAVEYEKLENERKEIDMKAQQAKEGKALTIAKLVIDGAAIVLPVWASWVWMGRGLQFEKTGTFTTRTGNWLGGNLRVFKK